MTERDDNFNILRDLDDQRVVDIITRSVLLIQEGMTRSQVEQIITQELPDALPSHALRRLIGQVNTSLLKAGQLKYSDPLSAMENKNSIEIKTAKSPIKPEGLS